jgi:hypothetical protein
MDSIQSGAIGSVWTIPTAETRRSDHGRLNYDDVIVGAGFARCVLATHISERNYTR